MDSEEHRSNSKIDVDPDALMEILKELDDKKQSVTEANGRLRSRIKAVIEETGWHNGALATIRQIEAMSETSRADFLRTFIPMLGVMREHKWADEMEDLFGGEAETAQAAAE